MFFAGSPGLWSPPPLPVQVKPDRGRSFVDQNGYRLGPHALAPLFAAADVLEASREQPFQWGTVDVVTDRNNLLKLLGWLDPAVAKLRQRNSWRTDVALAGSSTLLMRRWEERAVVSSDGSGFGYRFERACSQHTVGACKQDTFMGNHRVVAYVCGHALWTDDSPHAFAYAEFWRAQDGGAR